MNQLVLITALVTGAVSMSGIWLGNRLTRKNEDQKWRRDRCLEAYSDFLYAVEMAISESAKAYASECGTEEHVTQCGVALNKVAEMHRTGGRIILLASDRLQSHFAALTST